MGNANGVRSRRLDPEQRAPCKEWQRSSDQQQKVRGQFVEFGSRSPRQRNRDEEAVKRRERNDARAAALLAEWVASPGV